MRAMDIETDRKLIAELGGPSRVASMLGIDDKGTQRVHNWMRRGIPAAVRVEHPHLFMPTPGRIPRPRGAEHTRKQQPPVLTQ